MGIGMGMGMGIGIGKGIGIGIGIGSCAPSTQQRSLHCDTSGSIRRPASFGRPRRRGYSSSFL